MGLINDIKNLFRPRVKNSVSPNVAFLSGADFPYVNSVDNEMKLSAVYSAITTISSTMAKIPFFIMNRYTKEHIDYENIYKLLNTQPNGLTNAATMHEMITNWFLYYGESFVLVERKYRSNEVIERIPFSPQKVQKKIDKKNRRIYYDLTFPDGHTERRESSEVEHLMAFTLDGINGISPLEYARNAVQVGLTQDRYNEEILKRYNRPLDYLKTQTDLSSKPFVKRGVDSDGNDIKISAKEAMREEWEHARKLGSTAILDMGMDYDTVPQITPEQMQFVTSKDVTVQDIARFFRMGSCMFKLGVGKQSYSTNEQGQICYINETIAPWLRQWEQELTLKLLTEEQRKKGWVIKGNLNAELRGDTAARMAWYKGMKEMGVYNINEIRAKEDEQGIGELGDVRTIGPNAVPLEKAVSGETAADITPNNVSEDSDNDE